jgi:hypothetical protein
MPRKKKKKDMGMTHTARIMGSPQITKDRLQAIVSRYKLSDQAGEKKSK